MTWNRSFYVLGIAIGTGMWFAGFSLPALAETKFSKQAELQANEKTVKEILAAFDQAEAALKAQDLKALMALYSKDFNYNGLKKNDLRETWKDLFNHFRRISSHHIFSKIIVMVDSKTPMAEITCTGGLWATSETTGERVNIDSWFEEIHRLVYEDGAWRIRGHAGEGPEALRFGTAHPFF